MKNISSGVALFIIAILLSGCGKPDKRSMKRYFNDYQDPTVDQLVEAKKENRAEALLFDALGSSKRFQKFEKVMTKEMKQRISVSEKVLPDGSSLSSGDCYTCEFRLSIYKLLPRYKNVKECDLKTVQWLELKGLKPEDCVNQEVVALIYDEGTKSFFVDPSLVHHNCKDVDVCAKDLAVKFLTETSMMQEFCRKATDQSFKTLAEWKKAPGYKENCTE